MFVITLNNSKSKYFIKICITSNLQMVVETWIEK